MNDVLQGHWDTRFDEVAEALADEITNGEEVGAAIAIDIDGELVVDMWGGEGRGQDRRRGRRHDRQRLLVDEDGDPCRRLMLIDRGLLDAYCPVAKYWPEFAETASRTSRFGTSCPTRRGIGLGRAVVTRGPLRLGEVDSLLARQAPWWEPGRPRVTTR